MQPDVGVKMSLRNKWRAALRVMAYSCVKVFSEPDTEANAVHTEHDEFFLSWLENLEAKHDVGHATPAEIYRAAIRDCGQSPDVTAAGTALAREASAIRGAGGRTS